MPSVEPILELSGGLVLSGFKTSGVEAVRWWQQLNQKAPGSGQWPLLVSDDLPAWLNEDRVTDSAKSLASAVALDGATILTERGRRKLDIYGEELGAQIEAELGGGGEWPASPHRRTLDDILLSETGKPLSALLVLIPCEANWQIPCVLGQRGWNWYPDPDEHAAILRRWHDTYVAELVADFGSTVHIGISAPPTTRAEALKAAWEYRRFSDGDYDLYRADTLTDLAGSLIEADLWSAWWD